MIFSRQRSAVKGENESESSGEKKRANGGGRGGGKTKIGAGEGDCFIPVNKRTLIAFEIVNRLVAAGEVGVAVLHAKGRPVAASRCCKKLKLRNGVFCFTGNLLKLINLNHSQRGMR